MDKQIILLDGNNTAHRALATLMLTNPRGEDVSVIYGVLKMVQSMLKQFDPQLFIVCWDHKGGSDFRNQLYPAYKAKEYKDEKEEQESQRRRAELYRQMDLLHKNLYHFGIEQVRIPGVEADDIMYKLATTFAESGHTVNIISSDKDLWQLVDEEGLIRCFNPIKGQWIHSKNFEQVAGVRMDQYLDYKVLQGDSSDNIPGIRGWGEVTTQKYLQQYGSVTGIFQALKQQSSLKVIEQRLLDSQSQLDLNYGLMDLKNVDTVVPDLMDKIQEAMTNGQAEFNPKLAKAFCQSQAFVSLLTDPSWWIPFANLGVA